MMEVKQEKIDNLYQELYADHIRGDLSLLANQESFFKAEYRQVIQAKAHFFQKYSAEH